MRTELQIRFPVSQLFLRRCTAVTAVIGMVIRFIILDIRLDFGTTQFVFALAMNTPYLVVLVAVWKTRKPLVLSLACLATTVFASVGNYQYFDAMVLFPSTLNGGKLVVVTGFELLTLIVLIPFALIGKFQKSVSPTGGSKGGYS